MTSFALFFTRAMAMCAMVAVLAACVSNPSTVSNLDAAPKPGHGTVVVKGSIQGLKFVNNFYLKARPLVGGETVSLQTWGASNSGYWSNYYDECAKGATIAVSLPQGEYEFYAFSALSGAWGGLRAVQSGKPFSKKFRVTEGEVTYLGYIAVIIAGDRGALPDPGGTMKFDTRISVRDELNQDLKEIASLTNTEQIKVRLAR